MYSVYAKLRDMRGLKDMDISKGLGFHPSVISDWKRGKSVPKYEKLKQIADFFGVSVEYLTTGEQPEGYYLNPETAEVAQEIYDNKELRLLFDAARDVTPEQLRILQQMALSWKNQGQKNGQDE